MGSRQTANCTVEYVTTQSIQLFDKFRRVRKVSNIEDPTGTSTEDSIHVQLPQWDLYHTIGFTNVSLTKVVNIDLVEERTRLDQMDTEKVENTNKEYLVYLNDESLDTQSITIDNDSHLNSEDSLLISCLGTCVLQVQFSFTECCIGMKIPIPMSYRFHDSTKYIKYTDINVE
uniref:Uncharacterized protein n=1 Tax=Daphnia galeata TaxID=27404 RepID=A0A8J2RYG4_9CRUS|nr:unnamed protein product [Daphnia galeata]